MPAHDLTHAVWRKSSYSNGSGNACVEVAYVPETAVWRKSSRSNGSGNECVEVAFPGATALRDSKNPGPVLVADLRALLTAAKSNRFDR